jgi:hypothetical protein
LRKYLVAATVAALSVAAFAAVSYAQTPAASMKVKVAPKKAGTKKKPKNSKIKLSITNGDSKKTLSKLTITTPKTFTLSAKGLTKCGEATLEAGGPEACPKASRVGTGVAHALLGVNGPTPSPLTFDVTAVVLGAKDVAFHLQSLENPSLAPVAPGKISGRKLTISVPGIAQQPFPGTWAGLVSLETTLGAKKGKHYLASTTGCKKKKHAFSTLMTFAANGVSDPTPLTVKASSKCTK